MHPTATSRCLTALSFAWLVAGAAACSGGGGSDGPTTPAGPTPAFSLALSANAPTVQQSGSGAFNVTISRSGGFTGAVDLTVEGAPALVTPTLQPSTIPAGSTSSTITLAVSLNQPAGTYPMTIRARAAGLSDQTASMTLTVVTRPASITLSRATTSALTTFAGGLAVNATLVVSRVEFLGDVAFSVVSGLPAGLTATFAPTSTTANSTVVTFTAAASTAPGTYDIVLQGTGTGITPATLTVPFTVTPAASLSVGVSRNPISVAQNGSGVTTVSITRTNFTGAVTLETSTLPAGVTRTFDSNPIGTNSTGLTFTVGPSAVAGSYPITLTASAPGVTGANVVVTLVVTATGTGGNTTLRFCGTAADIPIWLAHSAGNSWTRVTAGASDTYQFDFQSPGGIAWVTQAGADDFRLTIIYGTLDEVAQRASSYCLSPSSRSATGSVTGIGATSLASVWLGARSATTLINSATPGFTINRLPDGALDLLATRSTLDVSTSLLLLDRIFIQRAVNPANGGSVGTIDLAGANSFTPETKTLTIQNSAAGEQLVAATMFMTNTLASIPLGTTVGTTASIPYSHVPAARTVAGDMHLVSATANVLSGQTFVSSRTATRLMTSPANLNLALGAAPDGPTSIVFALGNGAYRYRTTFNRQADYNKAWVSSWTQSSGGTQREVSMTFTLGYAGAAGGTIVMTMPDFSTTNGWQHVWGPRVGLTATWAASASGWSVGGGFGGPQSDGTVILSYLTTGTITP